MSAEAIRTPYPTRALERGGRLNDAGLSRQFPAQIFASARLRYLVATAQSRTEVMDFQRREKLLLMAHYPAGQKELGRLIATVPGDLDQLLRS